MLGTAKQTYDYLTCGVGCPTDLESHALAVCSGVKEGVARGEFAQVGTSCVITLYYVLSDGRIERRCDDVQERQRVLLRQLLEIL